MFQRSEIISILINIKKKNKKKNAFNFCIQIVERELFHDFMMCKGGTMSGIQMHIEIWLQVITYPPPKKSWNLEHIVKCGCVCGHLPHYTPPSSQAHLIFFFLLAALDLYLIPFSTMIWCHCFEYQKVVI